MRSSHHLNRDRPRRTGVRLGIVTGAMVSVGLWGAGCGPESAGRATFAVRDSAGVRIVDYETLDAAPRFEVVDPPAVDLGGISGDPAVEFYQVTSGDFLSDGSFVVVNAGSEEVRLFGADGEALASYGTLGDGPGEFRRLVAVDAGPGDSVFAYDAGRRRLTVLTPALEFARLVSFQGDYRNLELGGVFADGDVLLVDNGYAQDSTEVTQQQFYGRYVLVDAGGQPIDSVGLYPWFTLELGESGTDLRGIRVLLDDPSVRDASGDVLWIGSRKLHEIEGRDASGTLRLLLRWPAVDRSVTPEDIEEWKRARLAEVAPSRLEAVRAQLELAPFSDVFPTHGGILAGSADELWLQEYRRPGDQGGQLWRVFERDGVLRAAVELPEGATVLAVREGRVLVVERDEFDVEHVRVYEVVDAAGGRLGAADQ